jgi:hypothetical protein
MHTDTRHKSNRIAIKHGRRDSAQTLRLEKAIHRPDFRMSFFRRLIFAQNVQGSVKLNLQLPGQRLDQGVDGFEVKPVTRVAYPLNQYLSIAVKLRDKA